jgi:hypothetical protein
MRMFFADGAQEFALIILKEQEHQNINGGKLMKLVQIAKTFAKKPNLMTLI